MKGKIAIVGHGSAGLLAAARLKEELVDVIASNPLTPEEQQIFIAERNASLNEFHVNGVTYEPIPRPGGGVFSGTRMLSSLILLAETFSPAGFDNGYERQLPVGTDIAQEFILIQQKKSRLSKWERDEVIRIFHQNFRPVKQK